MTLERNCWRHLTVRTLYRTIMRTFLLTGCLAGGYASLGLSISAPDYPVAVEVESPEYKYDETAHSLKEIDFKNFHYSLFGTRIILHNGSLQRNQKIAATEAVERIEVSLKQTFYFDFQDDEPRHALLALDYFEAAGSSSDRGVLLLFTLIDDHPVITQQLDYDRQAPGTGDSFDAKQGILTITARARDGSAHCCPQNVEIDKFRWAGQKFVLSTRKTMKAAGAENR